MTRPEKWGIYVVSKALSPQSFSTEHFLAPILFDPSFPAASAFAVILWTHFFFVKLHALVC